MVAIVPKWQICNRLLIAWAGKLPISNWGKQSYQNTVSLKNQLEMLYANGQLSEVMELEFGFLFSNDRYVKLPTAGWYKSRAKMWWCTGAMMIWAAVLLILAHWWQRMAKTIAVAAMAWQTDGARAWWRHIASGIELGNTMLNGKGNVGKCHRTDRWNGFTETDQMAHAMVVAMMALEGSCNSSWWMATYGSTEGLNGSTVTAMA